MSRSAEGRRRNIAALVAVVVAGVALAAAGGWWFLDRSGPVDGQVHYTGDRPSSMTIGPNGWFTYSDDQGDWVAHAPTGTRWGGERLYGRPVLASDGTVVSTLGPNVRIAREDELVEVEGVDLLVAHGDTTLQPGGDVDVIGVSTEHAAVVSCLSPAGGARLDEPTPGGRLVLSGISLEDGGVDWSHDTRAGCDSEVTIAHPDGLPEQRYALLTPEEETSQALDLDTGRIAATWRQAPRGRVILWKDRAVRRAGDTVTVTSLRSGKELEQTRCAGARLDGTGDPGGRLAAAATPLVRCGDSVRLLGEEGFVTVDAPPVQESQQVADGRAVVHDRYLISRAGTTLSFRDALADRDVGTVEVPTGFRIATNNLRGRLIVMYRPAEKRMNGASESSFRIIDTRNAELVAQTDDDLSPGAKVSTDGYPILGEFVERRRSRPSRSHAWLVGVAEVEQAGRP